MYSDPNYMKKWYAKNRDRILAHNKGPKRKAVVDRYRASKKGIAAARRMRDKRRTPAGRKRLAEVVKARRERNPARFLSNSRRWFLKKKFGITLEMWLEMRRKQKHACAICHKRRRLLNLDHCYRTGKVRALLCTKCNFMLGLGNDSVAVFREAARYLKRWK